MKGVLSVEDRELIWDAALGCGFIPVEYKVRENTVIHLYVGDGPGHYWNPLDHRTGHHLDIMAALPMDIRIDRYRGTFAVAVSIDVVVADAASDLNGTREFKDLFCRCITMVAAQTHRRTQPSFIKKEAQS